MIHYHGGPVTPLPASLALWQGRHAMVSFARPDQIALVAEVCQSFALRYMPETRADDVVVRRDFVSPFLAECPDCHGLGEFDTPHGTVGCQACNSRVIQLMTPAGVKFADWGDWIVVRIYNASRTNPVATATCDVFSHDDFLARFTADEH